MAEQFPLERFDEISKHPQDFRLLERVPITYDGILDKLPLQLTKPEEGELIKQCVFLDTETTGMDPNSNKIIELGLVRCSYSMDRRCVLSIDRWYDEFEDPQAKIPAEVTQLTGITDAMVAGKKFDADIVGQIFAGKPLIIAHNARFDRPFVDRRFPLYEKLAWECSLQSVDWEDLGFNGRKLEFLVQSSGYFYKAHRAYVDCLALIWLMHLNPAAFDMLITKAMQVEYQVIAKGSPFSVKDQLKGAGYRWNGTRKVWSKTVGSKVLAEQEKHFLIGLYDGEPEVVRLNAANRYKS